MSLPKRVVIIGGTHGNEWTGIKIVEHYQVFLQSKYPTLELEFIFANPEAHQLNRRFKDEDLNRASEFLNEKRNSYEHGRAKEIKAIIESRPCLVIDLHTTTANMGNTLILTNTQQDMLHLCASVNQKGQDCRVLMSPDPNKKYLTTQSQYGVMVEVGPIANSVVDGKILESTLSIIHSILEVVEGDLSAPQRPLEIFEEVQDVSYPKSEDGTINAYIHSDLQSKDFIPMKGKMKAFKAFSGADISIDCAEELYPIFINEAAYYPTQLAFTLCRKKTLTY
jgi:aspartoacylase